MNDTETRSLLDNNSSSSSNSYNVEIVSTDEVIHKIEEVIKSIIDALDNEETPTLQISRDCDGDRHHISHHPCVKRFNNISQCRSVTGILMVLSYCYSLLLSRRTSSTREVYYFYVTHFRGQRECDAAIIDAANLLQVPRSALGLHASPKGWFCGCIQLIDDKNNVIMDGQHLSSIQGAPITSEWLNYYHAPQHQRKFTITSYFQQNNQGTTGTEKARCILVIEKEGIYHRFSENRLYDRYPCILVTGKGFPDLATRSLVHALHKELSLPVYGICDCNPYGVLVLHTYEYGSERLGMDGGYRYSVPIQWLGLRPTQIEKQQQQGEGGKNLPEGVYQQLTDLDRKRLEQLCDANHLFHNHHHNDNSQRSNYCDNHNDYTCNNHNNKYKQNKSRLKELQKNVTEWVQNGIRSI